MHNIYSSRQRTLTFMLLNVQGIRLDYSCLYKGSDGEKQQILHVGCHITNVKQKINGANSLTILSYNTYTLREKRIEEKSDSIFEKILLGYRQGQCNESEQDTSMNLNKYDGGGCAVQAPGMAIVTTTKNTKD